MSDPIVHVTNHSTRELFIDHDPNWDDQVLLVDGKRINQTRRLKPEASAEVRVPTEVGHKPGEYMMGVIFADGRDYDYGPAGSYQMTIGQNPQTGLLGVTDESRHKNPAIHYTTSDHTPSSMKMEFLDAQGAAALKSFAF